MVRATFNREPAVILAVTSAAINLAIDFGADLSPTQVADINILLAAIVALIVRQKSTPNVVNDDG